MAIPVKIPKYIVGIKLDKTNDDPLNFVDKKNLSKTFTIKLINFGLLANLKIIDEMPKFDGQISARYVETKPNEFFMIGEWNSEDDIAKARPKMIGFLDTLRHTLDELSPELGVTDPHSGTVVVEK